MNNSLESLLIGEPIPILKGLKLYQPTLKEIVIIKEEKYNALLKIWTIERKELVPEENEYTLSRDDYQIWLEYILAVPRMQEILINSCLVFFHKKIEFFPLSNTMYIGEGENGILLDYTLFSSIRDLFLKLDYTQDSQTESQYKETENMSEREKKIYQRLRAGEEKLRRIKNGENSSEDPFGKQIVALTAIGKYTFKEVYNMTMLQFTYLLKKYLEIEQYELHTVLSPYMNSKDNNQENKHWLN